MSVITAGCRPQKMNDPIFSSPGTSELCAPYSLTFEQRPGYLYAYVKADTMTLESAVSYLRQIADRCADLDCRRVLIERDVPSVPSTADLFFIGQEFARMIRGAHVAMFNPHASNESSLNFAMMVGSNRGAHCEVHRTFDSAVRWLLAFE